jgi:NIMA (never in mitosis gene a)-related kinase
MKEESIWNYLIQISQGLQYLHKSRILHRDIKPHNIFLDEDDNVKIGDMGLGRILGPQVWKIIFNSFSVLLIVYIKSTFAYTGVGTPLYFSPEMCNEKPYNQKGDIWAFGCLMYELCTFRPPFIASNQIALAKKICNEEAAPLPNHIPRDLTFLIMKMLQKDPEKRPDIEQILSYSGVKIRVCDCDTLNLYIYIEY